MKSLQWLPASFLLLVLSATAVGQDTPAPTTQLSGLTPGILSALISAPFSIGNGVGHGVEGVKGGPFSADVTYEFTQVLADENRIHRESHGRIFRDGEGRVRNEIEDEMPLRAGIVHITIHDPVSQTFVTLFPQNKRAVVNHMMVRMDGAGRGIGVGFAADSSGAAATQSTAERLEELKAVQPAQAAVPGIGRRPLKREELGAKEIEGVMAFGLRYSTTIGAGEIGNEKPIVTVNETWRSDDLKADLVSIYNDPRSGRRVTRMTNILVGEPDAQLFQIPADYTVQEFPTRPKTAAKPGQ